MKDISRVNKVNKEQKKDVKTEKHRQTGNKEDILEDMQNGFPRPVWRQEQSPTSNQRPSLGPVALLSVPDQFSQYIYTHSMKPLKPVTNHGVYQQGQFSIIWHQ